ncbi:MAG TPA: hypothetical protein VOB72_16920 [Candidatus Dormibacteraeota bacterium]|nr:hypothetical protein [Candidatus Dormibacteraeota bacterium]
MDRRSVLGIRAPLTPSAETANWWLARVHAQPRRLAIADASAMALTRSAQDLQLRRMAALERADHEAAARLRAEEAVVRDRLLTALAEWRRLAG